MGQGIEVLFKSFFMTLNAVGETFLSLLPFKEAIDNVKELFISEITGIPLIIVSICSSVVTISTIIWNIYKRFLRH